MLFRSMGKLFCNHVYVEMDEDICNLCGDLTRRTDWKKQEELHKEWIASGKATYGGWWSI